MACQRHLVGLETNVINAATHFANLAMVSILGLLLKTLPFLQHLGIWERDPVDPLQSLHVRTALPVS